MTILTGDERFNPRCEIRYASWRKEFEVAWVWERRDGSVEIRYPGGEKSKGYLMYQTIEPHVAVPDDLPVLRLDGEYLEQLYRALHEMHKKEGRLPMDEAVAQGKLEVQGRHLEDMRRLVFSADQATEGKAAGFGCIPGLGARWWRLFWAWMPRRRWPIVRRSRS